MSVKTLVKKVINYNDIPKEVLGDFSFNLMRGEFAQQCPTYLEVHFEEEDNSPLDIWFKETHPDLVKEESFLICFDPINFTKESPKQIVNNNSTIGQQTSIDTNIGDIK